MPLTINVLVLIGLSDANMVEISGVTKGNFNFSFSGNLMLFRHLDCTGFKVERIHVGGPVGGRKRMPPTDIIFNAVCDADDNNRALAQVDKIARQLGVPVINPPAAVRRSTREHTAELLADQPALQVPRVLRVRPERQADIEAIVERGGIDMPFIMRPAGGHNGANMLLVDKPEDLWRTQRFAFDGSEYYLIEFVDFVDDDGWYRKYRFLVIDGEVYPRHVVADRHWNVHAPARFKAMAQRPELYEQERAFLADFESRLGGDNLQLLRSLNQRLGLDYLGLDCSLRPDGRLLLFETNACINAFTQTRRETGKLAYLQPYVDRIANAARALVLRKAGRAAARA